MASHVVLVVDDEAAIRESVVYALRRDGFQTLEAETQARADELAACADLIVLDLMLPDGSGFDLISQLRRRPLATPILVLSSRDSEADRVAALETGADDYVTKPFSPREVVARVRAILRRLPQGRLPENATNVSLPPGASVLHIDLACRRASLHGEMIELTKLEFDLLAALNESPGRVYTRAQLIDRIWGDGFAVSDRTIDSHVKSLRRKIQDAGGPASLVETVRGVGYRIDPQATEFTVS